MASGILVPRPGIEPMPPASEGGFLTTEPPGKSWKLFLSKQLELDMEQQTGSK